MVKVFLAAMFTYLFLREIGAAVSGAIVSAIVFAFSGFMTSWLAWPRADTSLWLPLMCFQVHRMCRQPSRRQAILLAGVLAMPILAGHPGIGARILATTAVYSLWIIFWQHNGMSRRQQLLWLSVAGCLAVGLAAVQLIPSIEWVSHLFRTLDMPAGSLPPTQAIGFFSRDLSEQPNSAGVFIPDAAVYAGTLSLLAAAFAFFHRRKKDIVFFAIVFAVSCCTAYGVPPFPALSLMLPVFHGLRMDEALMLADFSLAVLAGFGVSYLETFEWKRPAKTQLAGAVLILLLATAVFHKAADVLSKMTQPGLEWWRTPRSFRVLLVVSAVVIGLRLLQLLSRRQWVVAVSLLAAVDLVSVAHGHMPFNRVETIYPKVPMFDFLSQQPKPFRVVSLDHAAPENVEYVYGLSTASGYEYMLKRMSLLSESLIQQSANGYSLNLPARGIVESNNRILDLLNVRYLIATKYNESESLLNTRPDRFRKVWSDEHASVFENLRSLPRAFLVPQANTETISSEAAQLARLQEGSFDPEHRVILPSQLEPGDGENENSNGFREAVKYSQGLNWVDVQVNATSRSVLVLTQIHYPGWKVYVDGKPAELLRPDYAFTGAVVDAGTHQVEFRFLPITFIVGLVISAGSLVAALVVWRTQPQT
jgi:hypothetical protein